MLDINTRLYNNNNIHVKINGGAAGMDLNGLIFEISEAVFWNDTYFYGDPICLGNDCAGYTLYNTNRDCIYILTARDIIKLKDGHTVILYGRTPDTDDRETINECLFN